NSASSVNYGIGASGDSLMTDGIAALYTFMAVFTSIAQQKYQEMTAKAERARVSQQMANQVDYIISAITTPGGTGNLPNEVYEYFKENKIMVTANEDIVAYIKNHGDPIGNKLKKGELEVLKGVLEADSGRCSDFVAGAQLQIQKSMQSYNVCVSTISSMQTLLADMCKMIGQAIGR
ncbi:hypothetical protein, partial [Paraburkholderia sp. RL17-373-BIF-A]|uniref:hypothetical protein n=1 Tax=Paraburkholderia sp. RL17-373-BIF-A TaxID=3031629 RepID=UPI0038BA2109